MQLSGVVGAWFLDWLFKRDRYTGRVPIVRAIPFLLVTAAAVAYGVIATGRASGSVLFLAISAATLVEALRFLMGAARALFVDPPAADVVVATGRRRKELEREKASLLKALKELEFDHEMGKVSDADFAEIGGVYRARAIRVLRQLDERQVDYATVVEEELRRDRKGKGKAAPTADPLPRIVDDAEVLTPSQCKGCGTVNDRDAVFCKKCAARLGSEATA